MTERHAPARGAWTAPIRPAGRRPLDPHAHTTPLGRGPRARRARARRRPPPASGSLAITDHDTLGGLPRARRRRGVPAGLELVPGVEINALTRGTRPRRSGELHILGLRDGPRRRGVRGGPRRPARRAPRSASSGRVERLRELGLAVDDAARPHRPHPRRRARPADDRPGPHRRRPRDERRGRVRAADRAGAGRPTSRARGSGPREAIRAIRGGRRLAVARPLRRGARRSCRCSASCARSAWPGSRSTTSRSTADTVEPVGAVARGLGLRRDGWLGLPRRHDDVRGGARGAARVPDLGGARRARSGRYGLAPGVRCPDDDADRTSSRALPVLDVVPPRRRSAGPRAPPTPPTRGSTSTGPRRRACRRSTSGRSAAR